MTYTRCTGTGLVTAGWPGDDDTCPVCCAWVRVARDGTLRAHRARARDVVPPPPQPSLGDWLAQEAHRGTLATIAAMDTDALRRSYQRITGSDPVTDRVRAAVGDELARRGAEL